MPHAGSITGTAHTVERECRTWTSSECTSSFASTIATSSRSRPMLLDRMGSLGRPVLGPLPARCAGPSSHRHGGPSDSNWFEPGPGCLDHQFRHPWRLSSHSRAIGLHRRRRSRLTSDEKTKWRSMSALRWDRRGAQYAVVVRVARPVGMSAAFRYGRLPTWDSAVRLPCSTGLQLAAVSELVDVQGH